MDFSEQIRNNTKYTPVNEKKTDMVNSFRPSNLPLV